MKIAILSDIHDNISNLKKALLSIKENNCDAIIFCGDYASPPTFKTLAEINLPIYAIFGNVDGAHYEIMQSIQENKYRVKQEKDLHELELEGKKIAVCHRPEFAEGLAATGKYDAVFHGHTHEKAQKMVGKTLIANPGEIYGGKSKATFGIYETKSEEFRIIEV